MERDVHYSEALSSSTSTSPSAPTDHNTLTFNAKVGGKYFIISSQVCNIDTTSVQATVLLSDLSVAIQATSLVTQHDATNYHSFGQFAYFNYDTLGGSRSFAVSHKPGSSGRTTTMKESRLMAIEEHADDEVYRDREELSTSSTSFVDKGSVTLNPSGTVDYLILAFANANIDVGSRPLDIQMYDGTTAYDVQKIRMQETTDWTPYNAAFKLSGVSGSVTVSLQIKVNNAADIGKVREVMIVAMPLNTFAADYYAEQLTRQTTNSASYVTALSLTSTPAAADHLVFGVATLDGGNVFSNDCIFDDDGTAKLNALVEPSIGSGDADYSVFYCAKETYAAASRTWAWKHLKSGAGVGPVGLDDISIAVLDTTNGLGKGPATIIHGGNLLGGTIY